MLFHTYYSISFHKVNLFLIEKCAKKPFTAYWRIFFLNLYRLVQRKLLRADQISALEDIQTIVSGIQKLFHIPEYIHVLFLTVVFDILFDGVSQCTVFVRESVGCTLGQCVIIRFGDTYIDGTFAILCRNILHDCKADSQLHDVFHFLCNLPPFIARFDTDIGHIELGSQCHLLIQILLFFGKCTDLL